ncbi:MAG: hypothetical protein VYE40_15750 [Myxococcota bacterium]|nr:hypothetical protein [Myxococcota bacterium]
MTRSPTHDLWTLLFALLFGAALLACGFGEDEGEEELDTGPRCSFWTSEYKRVSGGKIHLNIEAAAESMDMIPPLPDNSKWLIGVNQGSGNSVSVKACVRHKAETKESLFDNDEEDEEAPEKELEPSYWSEWELDSVWQFNGPVRSTTKLWAGRPIPGAASVTLNISQNKLVGDACIPDHCSTNRLFRQNFSESGVSRAEVDAYDIGFLDARGWVLDNNEEDKLFFDFDITW